MKIDDTLNDLMIERWIRRRNSGDIVWKTKDGKEIPIKDMDDRHIENVIRRFTCYAQRNEALADAAAGFPE